MRYKLVLIEGIDGSGKGVVTDTFRELAEKDGLTTFDLRKHLKSGKDFPEYKEISHYNVILSAEPTYGWIGKAIREEMIKDNGRKYSALAVAQAYSLDRKILYKRLLIEALENGKIVLQERGVVSSLAYQPLQAQLQGENLFLETVMKLPGNKLAIEDYPPSIVIITRVNPETAIRRLEDREKKDLCIFERLEFQKKLQERYESTWLRCLLEKQGSKVLYFDTNESIDSTKEQVKNLWEEYLKEGNNV